MSFVKNTENIQLQIHQHAAGVLKITDNMHGVLSATIYTYHYVRAVDQWIEKICGLYKRQTAMANRYNRRV